MICRWALTAFSFFLSCLHFSLNVTSKWRKCCRWCSCKKNNQSGCLLSLISQKLSQIDWRRRRATTRVSSINILRLASLKWSFSVHLLYDMRENGFLKLWCFTAQTMWQIKAWKNGKACYPPHFVQEKEARESKGTLCTCAAVRLLMSPFIRQLSTLTRTSVKTILTSKQEIFRLDNSAIIFVSQWSRYCKGDFCFLFVPDTRTSFTLSMSTETFQFDVSSTSALLFTEIWIKTQLLFAASYRSCSLVLY